MENININLEFAISGKTNKVNPDNEEAIKLDESHNLVKASKYRTPNNTKYLTSKAMFACEDCGCRVLVARNKCHFDQREDYDIYGHICPSCKNLVTIKVTNSEDVTNPDTWDKFVYKDIEDYVTKNKVK